MERHGYATVKWKGNITKSKTSYTVFHFHITDAVSSITGIPYSTTLTQPPLGIKRHHNDKVRAGTLLDCHKQQSTWMVSLNWFMGYSLEMISIWHTVLHRRQLIFWMKHFHVNCRIVGYVNEIVAQRWWCGSWQPKKVSADLPRYSTQDPLLQHSSG